MFPDETEVLEATDHAPTGDAAGGHDAAPEADAAAAAPEGGDVDALEPSAVGLGEAGVILDLGRRKRKAVRRLRDGEGPLMDEVEDHVAQLRREGVIGADAEVVIVVASYRRRRHG